MNEQLAGLLNALAAKLGVGVEVLWVALLKQAPIDSCVNVIIAALAVASGWLYFTKYLPFVRRLWRENHDAEVVAVIGAAFWGLFLVVIGFAFIFSLSTIIAGFYNPEYWALMEILSRATK